MTILEWINKKKECPHICLFCKWRDKCDLERKEK